MQTPQPAFQENLADTQPEAAARDEVFLPESTAGAALQDACVAERPADLKPSLDPSTADRPAMEQAASQTASAPSGAGTDETEPVNLTSERQTSLVLRPVAYRLGPPVQSGELPPESSAAASAGGLPLSTSGSLPLEKSTSLPGQPQQQGTPEGSPSAIGWSPRKSAWTPYRAKADLSSDPGKEAPPEQSQPTAAEARQEPEQASPREQRLETEQQAGRPEVSAAASFSVPLPVQSSLDILHNAAFSAAEGYFQSSPEQQPAATAAATVETEATEEPSAFLAHGETSYSRPAVPMLACDCFQTCLISVYNHDSAKVLHSCRLNISA